MWFVGLPDSCGVVVYCGILHCYGRRSTRRRKKKKETVV